MIATERLTKTFDGHTAVDALDCSVSPGEVVALLGPNGAGKSTAMKMIAGFLAPTSGRALVAGHDAMAEPRAARAALGYLPEGAPAYPEMEPMGLLGFLADVRGMRGRHRRQRLAAVVDELGLGAVRHQPIGTLSKGFQRRVALAQALLHDPPVLLMDEPTDGLDPNQKHEVRALLNAIAADKTIVISTHSLEEVEAVCTRAAVVSGGRLLVDESPGVLRARSRYRNAVTVAFTDTPDTAPSKLAALPGVEAVEWGLDRRSLVVFGADGLETAERIRAAGRDQGWRIELLRLDGGRLDDVFRAITQPAAGSA